MATLLPVENLGDPAPLRDRLAQRYGLVRNAYADGVRAAQAAGDARSDIDPDLKAIEVIAFLDGVETSWLLNPSIAAADVAEEWARERRRQLTAGLGDAGDRAGARGDSTRLTR
jgi:BetI-type transcriptional repressor, C-terminal